MAPHSSTLAWKIPWMEEPGTLQSMGSPRIGHDWATSLSLFTFLHWRRKWQPTPVFLPGESQGWGSWWAAVYGVTQSQTWLKWLSSSSSVYMAVLFSQLPHPPLTHVCEFILYICVSVPALQKVLLYHLFRFHTYVLVCNICFALSDLLHSVWRTPGPSTSLQMT